METTGHFHVEPRLIQILGAQYRSSEEAVKELVVNAWDADATQVTITLPDLMSRDPIVISDNGYGMTRRQVEMDYLRIAYDRRVKYGERTLRGRMVRGHRGIGKFAGLIAAETMHIRTSANGTCSTLVLNRVDIEGQGNDLEKAKIVIESSEASETSGTIIELHEMRQNFSHPSPVKLGRLLLREFGRHDDFMISINGDVLTPHVLDAKESKVELVVPTVGTVTGTIWLSNNPKAVPDPGIIIRVNGRAIGPPTFFDLDYDRDVPRSLLNRVCGELNADQLQEDIIASWDAFIENSAGYQALVDTGREWLKGQVMALRDEEAGQAPQEFVESFAEEIQKLPVPRRELARQALMRVFKRFYDEAEDKKKAIGELVLNAFELDDYWLLVKRIDESSQYDVLKLADVLRQWGLSDVAGVVQRARSRLKAVEAFEALIRDPATLELTGVHDALEQNTWLIGSQYELLKSNKGLRKLVKDVFDKKFQGKRAKNRPDLFLAGLRGNYLLVELKKPSHKIRRADVAQGETYRDELLAYLPNAFSRIDLVVIGGTVGPNLRRDDHERVLPTTFQEIAQGARDRMDWLIEHLANEFSEEEGDITVPGEDTSASE